METESRVIQFLAYLALFVFCMLILITAGNLLLLYIWLGRSRFM
jgi:NADH:ubiquinone oxidoreductase subunit 5 (subunit L)/multisubunit Na+/H+ antiporter MnhA subunit